MKKFKWIVMILLAGLLFASPVLAEEDKDSIYARCQILSVLATAIMDSRHAGVSMADSMEIASRAEPESLAEAIRQVVIEAYSEPRYHTEELRKRTTEDFRDRWYLRCVKGLSRE